MEKNKDGRRRRRASEVITTLMLIITGSVFVFSLVKVVTLLIPYYAGGKDYDDVKKKAIIRDVRHVHIETPENKDDEEPDEPSFKVDFDLLYSQNPDTVGWIRFDEPAIISYPVVKSADNAEYLTKTFTENDNKLGAIFMDKDNSTDFSDTNTIIYGHNMKVGNQMFSRIRDYSSEEFCQNYPYFYIYTPDNKERVYRVFAAGVVKDTADDYKVSFSTDESVEDFIQSCRDSSYYYVDTEVNATSKVVTLSTCTCVRDDERFVVHGVLVE